MSNSTQDSGYRLQDLALSKTQQIIFDKTFGTNIAKSPVLKEHEPVFRAALRSIYPKLSADKLARLASNIGSYVGEDVKTAIGKRVSPPELMQAVSELAYDQGPASKKIKGLADIFAAGNPQALAQDQVVTGQGKSTLRSRYGIPGVDTARVSKQQEVIDTSMSELFSYHPPEQGKSLLDIRNKQNQRMRWESPSQPRSTYDQNVLPFEIAWQYQQLPLEQVMEQRIEEGARVEFVKHLPPRFDVLRDVQANGTPFISGTNQSAPFGPDPFYSVPAGFTNHLGFKPDLPQYWRDPLAPNEFAQTRGKEARGQGGPVDFMNFPGPQLYW